MCESSATSLEFVIQISNATLIDPMHVGIMQSALYAVDWHITLKCSNITIQVKLYLFAFTFLLIYQYMHWLDQLLDIGGVDKETQAENMGNMLGDRPNWNSPPSTTQKICGYGTSWTKLERWHHLLPVGPPILHAPLRWRCATQIKRNLFLTLKIIK